MYILGFDIGGTKCAVVTAMVNGGEITLLSKKQIPTDCTEKPCVMLQRLMGLADSILTANPDLIGVSCGGPLDSQKGIILGPPNLPGWDYVEIVNILEERYSAPVKLQNDANACAVAEWKFGAAKGYDNVVFLTFGTGLGAGIILDGKLYCGTNGNAGEVGHIRLADDGPVGFGKRGSFEGFCSGGGIAQLGYKLALQSIENGVYPLYFPRNSNKEEITAKAIAEAALKGDATAIEVYKISGEYLGRGLSLIIDILNPEVIVIGSIFTRSKNLLWQYAKRVIEDEALIESASCCKVLPAKLSENIGDYAAVATALL